VTWSLDRAEEHLLGLELFGMRFGLERMRRLLTALGSPQSAFRAIHVVGTNGKSSTTRFAAGMLEAHGVRAGAYLSPHLTSFAERIRVGDADLSGEAFGAAVQRAAEAARKVERGLDEDERVTQFELLTAAAFSALAEAGVEVAAVEAGLGGRWDATNVLDAPVVVLTNVGLEHTRWLGPTVRDIAGEKLAVVRPGATLILGDDQPDVLELARATGARVDLVRHGLDAPLPAYQRRNAALAAAAVSATIETDAALLRSAAESVVVPGRFQRVAEAPLTIVDGAHNPAGVAALVEALPEAVGDRPLVACVSILDDKDAGGMLRALLPLCAGLVCTTSSNPRALPPATLGSLAGQLGLAPDAVAYERDARRALALAQRLAGADGAVIATGSIYLVADLLSAPGKRKASAL
jgi:dihydrofolate synthase / folylpolyglutamate synthase